MKALVLIEKNLNVEHPEVKEAISELEALQQHIKDLESQLSSNPLQLTCDGCTYSICDATTYAECASACYKCTRQPHRIDMYKFIFKKDTK